MDGANDWMPSQLERQLSPTQAVRFCLSPFISISHTQPEGKKTGCVHFHCTDIVYKHIAYAVGGADLVVLFASCWSN